MDFLETFAVAVLTALVTSGGVAFSMVQFRRQYLLEHRTERLIRRLLTNPRYRFRTFKTIKYHVGGFEDDELRKMILRAGGIRFKDNSDIEIWGMYDRVGEVLDAEWMTMTN